VIPSDAYKSDHVHVVPLVSQAVAILKDVLDNHRGASGEHILSGTDGKKRLAGWSKAKARMTRAICGVTGEKPLAPWTPHDLRRTSRRESRNNLASAASSSLNACSAMRMEA